MSPRPCPGRRRSLALGSALLLAAALPARALERPRGAVVLTLTGRLRMPNEGDRAHFDMDMLAALPQSSFSTRTPWYAQARRFTGPLLRDVLAAAGAQGTTLRLVALNDYRVDMPVDDAQRHDVVLARLLDDRPMSVRDKGPLFVIYPFDADPALRSAVYYARSAWQLRTIDVL
ncbi:MAG: hypothetical protein KF683_01580 [Rubrivivax sp.]|nr:hypothetical protein [Rubrivivax sp.]